MFHKNVLGNCIRVRWFFLSWSVFMTCHCSSAKFRFWGPLPKMMCRRPVCSWKRAPLQHCSRSTGNNTWSAPSPLQRDAKSQRIQKFHVAWNGASKCYQQPGRFGPMWRHCFQSALSQKHIRHCLPLLPHGFWSIATTTEAWTFGRTEPNWGLYDSEDNEKNLGSIHYPEGHCVGDITELCLTRHVKFHSCNVPPDSAGHKLGFSIFIRICSTS